MDDAPGALTRRPATPADVPFLMRLRHETMDAHFSASRLAMSEDDHLARLMHGFASAEVVLLDGQPVGLLKVDRGPVAWDLIQVQLAPHLQGRGIGSQLVQGVMAEAAAAGVEVTLGVLKANRARALYERLGFEVEGEDGPEYRMRWRP